MEGLAPPYLPGHAASAADPSILSLFSPPGEQKAGSKKMFKITSQKYQQKKKMPNMASQDEPQDH